MKTFIMEILHCYREYVPVLITVVELVPMLDGRYDGNKGMSLLVAFLQHQAPYPQHLHLLLQMMHMRRIVFLIDGIDESGSKRQEVEDFIAVELIEPGYKTIVTSRHSGFSSATLKQGQLVELQALAIEEQSEMVKARVPDEIKAAQLLQELRRDTFKEIATNPLMLSMMISVYVSNNCETVSNRAELYERALQTLLRRTDKRRDGIGQVEEEELFKSLHTLASSSHQRDGERRLFTDAQAVDWVGNEGWAMISRRDAPGPASNFGSSGRG
jgi:hypothetical protein